MPHAGRIDPEQYCVESSGWSWRDIFRLSGAKLSIRGGFKRKISNIGARADK
jgi:hypothetical protein